MAKESENGNETLKKFMLIHFSGWTEHDIQQLFWPHNFNYSTLAFKAIILVLKNLHTLVLQKLTQHYKLFGIFCESVSDVIHSMCVRRIVHP